MFKRQKESPKPVGILRGSFDELYHAGCIQVGGDDQSLGVDEAEVKFAKIFVLLLRTTNYNPCADCPAYNGGKCEAFKQYFVLQEPHRPKDPKVSHPRKYAAATKCPECGLKIRGSLDRHKEGEQHNRRMAAMKGK